MRWGAVRGGSCRRARLPEVGDVTREEPAASGAKWRSRSGRDWEARSNPTAAVRDELRRGGSLSWRAAAPSASAWSGDPLLERERPAPPPRRARVLLPPAGGAALCFLPRGVPPAPAGKRGLTDGETETPREAKVTPQLPVLPPSPLPLPLSVGVDGPQLLGTHCSSLPCSLEPPGAAPAPEQVQGLKWAAGQKTQAAQVQGPARLTLTGGVDSVSADTPTHTRTHAPTEANTGKAWAAFSVRVSGPHPHSSLTWAPSPFPHVQVQNCLLTPLNL